MKRILCALALFVLPGAARACDTYTGSFSTGCVTVYSNGGCATACYITPSFSTKHEWKSTAPGTITLTHTAFTITFSDTDWQFHLKWKDKELAVSWELKDVEAKGVERATDREAAGLPLE